MKVSEMVAAFHRAFGIPIRPSPTTCVPEYELRLRLLHEEVGEYRDAVKEDDVVGIADGLADIVYIAYGTALAYGIDLDAVLEEVHRSNMSKLGEDGQPILRPDGKVLKGPNYSPPDIATVLLRQHRWALVKPNA